MKRVAILLLGMLCSAGGLGCEARQSASEMRKLASFDAPMVQDEAASPEVLVESRFSGDQTGGITEEDLHEVLYAPVFLEENARIGVIEATLFDVKTGTILFTAFERFDGQRRSNIWHVDLKWDDLKEVLVEQAAANLAKKVQDSCRILARARLEYAARGADVSPRTAPRFAPEPGVPLEQDSTEPIPYGEPYATSTR